MTYHLHHGDLPEGLLFGDAVAVDTEAMGLNPHRDRLCLAQLSRGDGDAHLVQFAAGCYDAPNLKRLLADPTVVKLFHFARFDIAMFSHYLGVMPQPLYCTKIASRLGGRARRCPPACPGPPARAPRPSARRRGGPRRARLLPTRFGADPPFTR